MFSSWHLLRHGVTPTGFLLALLLTSPVHGTHFDTVTASKGASLTFLQFSEPPTQQQPAPSQSWDSQQYPANSFVDVSDSAANAEGQLDQEEQPEKTVLMQMASEGQRTVESDTSAQEQIEPQPVSQISAAFDASPQQYAATMPMAASEPEQFVQEPQWQQRSQLRQRSPAAPQRFSRMYGHRSTGLMQTESSMMQEVEQASAADIPRPGVATGTPDVVNFALYGKTFYGVDLKEQEYTIDSIMTLQWKDARAASLVPAGQDETTLSADDASAKIWMPKVAITNRIARRFDRISSSITVAKDGKVTQVERTLAVIKNKMILNDYPFDQQVLRLNIASTQYMLDEVVLDPMKSFAGLRKNFFDGEDYVKEQFKLHVYKDVDGSLKKSRGSMELTVSRSLSRFQRTFLLPAIIYLAISCAVFWLPFSPTFVTPRLALSILILLVFSNLATTADSELPSAAPYNWIDLLCFTIQLHMFAVVCLNIFTEIAYHSMKCTVTAVHISNELKVIAPLLATVSMVMILTASRTPDGVLDLHAMTALMPILFAGFLLTYMTCCGSTLSAEMARNKRADQMKHQDFGAGSMGPLASSESLAPAPEQ